VEFSFLEDLDPGQSLSPQASSGEHAGVTDWGILYKTVDHWLPATGH